jgi:radical SAM protein with 4Fe4S-binding SPASM domain
MISPDPIFDHLSVELTSACDLDCPLCPAGVSHTETPRRMMSEAVFERILEQLRLLPNKPKIALWNYGEPLLHPKAAEWAGRLEAEGFRCAISTNGQTLARVAPALAKAGLSELVVAVDGLCEETYQAYRRRGTLKRLLDGVAEYQRHRRRGSRLVMQFIVMAGNEHERGAAPEFARRHGFDALTVKTANKLFKADGPGWFEGMEAFLPSREEDRRFTTGASGPAMKGELAGHCHAIRSSLVLACDGAVLPCVWDSDREFRLGTVFDLDLARWWEDPRFAAFQAKVDDLQTMPFMCHACPVRRVGRSLNVESEAPVQSPWRRLVRFFA